MSWTKLSLSGALFLSAFGLASSARAQEGPLDVDFLFNYYNQDGENSAVTGGIGTEAMDVIAPVVVLNWQVRENWTLRANLGADSITSASVDAIEGLRSTASEVDTRVHSTVTFSRESEKNVLDFTTGYSKEYDYTSVSAGFGWSRDFNLENTTFSTVFRHYADTVDLYDIHGLLRGEDDRATSDVSMALTQVLGTRTVGTLELSLSDQSGFLSTPFHEVILATGERVAERLPDARFRTALGLRLNHAFGRNLAGRFGLRAYDDDWGVAAISLEIEPYFRIGEGERWIFPILRFHDQKGSDYFGLPGEFTESDEFLTADRDLSTFTSQKYGLGWKTEIGDARRTGWNRFETRLTYYTRDDGLNSISTSFSFGWSFR